MPDIPRNLPAIITEHTADLETDAIGQQIALFSQSFVTLPTVRKKVLLAYLQDFVTEDIRTDSQIAEDLGIDRKSVYNALHDPRFADAIGEIMPELARIKLPKVLVNAVKLSAKSPRVIEFLARFTGAYVPKSQSLQTNIHLRRASVAVSPDQAIDSFILKLFSLGWSPDRIYERAKMLQNREL